MTDKPTYGNQHADTDWGCDYYEVQAASQIGKIKVCHVIVKDIKNISEALAQHVLDTSWMTKLDEGSKRAYNMTVKETAAALVSIFNSVNTASDVGSEFGEIMVSIGSAKALEKIFDHVILPIAELWKPQLKQNEGFDFHTVCSNLLLNFGEAKYSKDDSPHGEAIKQSKRFIDAEKHLRDYVHLRELAPKEAVQKLNSDCFGIVAAFSINAVDPLKVLKNAIESAQDALSLESVKSIYIVGVSR